MKTSDIVERLLETDALAPISQISDDIYCVHEDDLEYLVDTIRGIMAENLREELKVDTAAQALRDAAEEWEREQRATAQREQRIAQWSEVCAWLRDRADRLDPATRTPSS